MAKGNGSAGVPTMALPDLHGMLASWEATSTQIAERSTIMARDMLGAGLRWMAQSAEGAEQWAKALGSSAQHWSDAAHAAEHKARTVDDLADLWSLELDVIGHTAESGADLGQQAWAAQLRSLSSLAQDGAAQAAQLMQACVDAGREAVLGAGGVVAPAPRSEPVVPFGLPVPTSLPDGVRTMTDATQAFWSAVAAQTAAAVQRLQREAEHGAAAAAAATTTGKARKPTRSG